MPQTWLGKVLRSTWKKSKGATQTAVTGFRSVPPVTQPPPPQSHSMKGSSDLRENTIHSDTFSLPLSGAWMLELRTGCHGIFQTRSLTAENKTGLWWLKSFQTWLLASTCFTTTKIKSDHQWRHLLLHNRNQIKPLELPFYSMRASRHLIFWSVLITGKIIFVCFCCTAQWGWDSLHPQINLEGPVLSAFYEENPPGDESWEYTLWQGRSCETGWFWPGWTFDGELWFHWAFHSLKVNIIKSGLPWRVWHMIIISVRSGFTTIKMAFLTQNKRLGAVMWKCLFPYDLCLHFTSKKMLPGRDASQNFYSPSWALISSESKSTLRKHSRAAREDSMLWG